MSDRTCITPGCTQPFYAIERCHGCYHRHRAGRAPKPYIPHPRREPLVAQAGDIRSADLDRIWRISHAIDSTPNLKPDDRAVLGYALEVALTYGSEKFEIRGRQAARRIDMPDRAMRSALARMIKLGWLEMVEPAHGNVSARYKLLVGRGKPVKIPCSWPGCPTASSYAQGLCKRCYSRENSNGRLKVKKVLHPLRNLNPEARTADCLTCGAVTGVTLRGKNGKVYGLCPAVIRANQFTLTAKKYGLTVEQYGAMISKQKGRCEICRVEAPLSVDHDHETGAVRDLLCRHCNFAVGQLRDNPSLAMRLARYLERHAQQRLPI